jgi:hypothetical protein
MVVLRGRKNVVVPQCGCRMMVKMTVGGGGDLVVPQCSRRIMVKLTVGGRLDDRWCAWGSMGGFHSRFSLQSTGVSHS